MIRRNGPKSRKILLFTSVLVMGLAFTTFNQEFLTPNHFLTLAQQTGIYAFLSVGMLFPLLTGGVDLSMGAAFSLSGLAACCAYISGTGPIPAVGIALASGLLIGLLNGLLAGELRLPAYVVTLAAMYLCRAGAYAMANFIANRGYFELSRAFPPEITTFLSFPDGLRISGPILCFTLICAHILLTRTRTGLYLYATGGGEQAAGLAGVHTGRVKCAAYMVSGLFAAMAGVTAAGSLGIVDAASGMGYETDALTAAILGGACLTGGQGSVPGMLFGALTLATLKTGLVIINADPLWNYAADGILLLIFVGGPEIRKHLTRHNGRRKNV